MIYAENVVLIAAKEQYCENNYFCCREKFQNKYKGRAKAGVKASSGDQRKPQTLFNQDD